MLTGVDRFKHRVRDNSFAETDFKKYPNVLSRYKKANPKGFAASVAHWEGIAKIVTPMDADHATTHKTAAETAKVACKILAEKEPDLVFVHFDDVDGAGHKFGFDPKEPKYVEAIAAADELVGSLLKSIQDRKTFAQEDWLILVSTDHGGKGKGHGQDIPECRTIFLIVSGQAAARGVIEPAPTIMDITPTALTHLGIALDPDWQLDGKAVGLKDPPKASNK
jgi:predicted AlkP superfamily pyrophosphatase or phosphodiesterase